jgi:mRNA interferase RelE/StbE
VFENRVKKDWKKIAKAEQQRIKTSINDLANSPRPSGCSKLYTGDYRIRVGDYRVIYSIDDTAQVISILAIGHRKAIYE